MINKIHYAIEIVTDYTNTIPAIGMDVAGVIRYVTDNVDTTSMQYEDGTAVGVSFNTSLLTKDGISQSSQKIDIITGGDFAYASSMSVSIANENALHKILLDTADLFLVGSKLTLYTIIDGVLYNRWTGVVGSYEFNEKTFKFNGVDKHKVGNDVIAEGEGVGYTYVETKLIEEDIELLIDGCFIKRITPDDNAKVVNYMYYQGNNTDGDDRNMKHYTGYNPNSQYNVVYNNGQYIVYLNGHYKSIKDDMLIQFKGSNEYYKILSLDMGEFTVPDSDGDPIKYTSIGIREIPDGITDYSQFKGIQEYYIKSNIVSDINKTDSETMYISVYESSVTLGDFDYVTVDGKYVAIDDDCNEILINTDANGKILLEDEYLISHKPISIGYWAEDYGSQFTSDLDNGLANHLETKYTDVTSYIPNDNRPSGNFFSQDFKRDYFFMCEYDIDLDNFNPYVLVDALTETWENWIPTDVDQGNDTPFFYTHDAPYDGRIGTLDEPWVPSQYAYTQYPSKADYLSSLFRGYAVTVYSVIEDNDFGEVPLLIGEYILPNLRYSKNLKQYKTDNWDIVGMNCYSVPATNISPNNLDIDNVVNSDKNVFISTTQNVIGWVEGNDISNQTDPDFSDSIMYPDQLLDYFHDVPQINNENAFTTKGNTKLLYRIEPIMDIGTSQWSSICGVPFPEAINNMYIIGIYDQGSNVGRSHHALIGLNSIGVYKSSNIDFKRLKLKVKPKVSNPIETYPELLRDYTGSVSALVNKDQWYVGKYYEREVNTFDEVTKLCKQGFTAGFSDRNGDVILTDFLNDGSLETPHNDNLILDKSLKSFKLSSLSKCYNDFTIKYDYRCGDYQAEFGVHKVDEDEFPPPNEFTNGTNPFPMGVDRTYWIGGKYDQNACNLPNEDYTVFIGTDASWDIIDQGKVLYINNTSGETELAVEVVNYCTPVDITCKLIYFNGTLPPLNDYLQNPYNTDNIYETDSVSSTETWKEYVVGVENYADAKSIWTEAHNSYLINRVVRKATSDRSNLEYAIDMDKFNGTDTGLGNKYAYDYFKMFVSWSTQQKLQVAYNIPITSDTIKLDLLDKIKFKDDIILPTVDEYGIGWITSLKLDTKKDLLSVELTFETIFMRGCVAPLCDTITETGYATTNIIETGTNTDTITEGECHNG